MLYSFRDYIKWCTVDVGIRTTFTDCITCNNTYPDVTPTPFVTSTATLSPTPTLTNTRTVTPTNQGVTTLVYAVNSGCTVSQVVRWVPTLKQ